MELIKPEAAVILPGRTVRDLASRSNRFDLFDPPRREGSGGVTGSVGTTEPENAWGHLFRPLVIAAPDGILAEARSEIVWGHHLLRIFPGVAGVANEAFPAILVDSGAGDAALLTLALAVEDRAGRYRWEELDCILALADELGATGVAPLVDPDRDVSVLVPRYRALPPVLQDALERERVDLRTAERLARLSAGLLAELLPLGEGLSFSRRRQFFLALEEVLRHGDGERSLLDELQGRTGEERFTHVLARRYPRLKRMEGLVDRVQRNTLRGTGVRIDPPAQFEGSRYRVSFEAGSVDELHRRLDAARRLENELDELLAILFEDPLDDPVAP